MVQVLARRTKNNPVLIGEPGVGKTAIVEVRDSSGVSKRSLEGKIVLGDENRKKKKNF